MFRDNWPVVLILADDAGSCYLRFSMSVRWKLAVGDMERAKIVVIVGLATIIALAALLVLALTTYGLFFSAMRAKAASLSFRHP